MTGIYLLDSVDMKTTYGVQVQKVSGILDILKRKGPTAHNWIDEDGEDPYTDADDINFEPRNIIVECYLVGTTRTDFFTKLGALKTVLESSGAHTFKTPYYSTTYNVYCRDGAAVNMITPTQSRIATGASRKYIAQFTIILREYSPARNGG